MSLDVLTYNALNADIKPLRTTVAAQETCIVNTNSSITAVNTTIGQVDACCQTLLGQIAANASNIVANAGPNQAHMWCLIPELPATGGSWTGGVLVCDDSNLWNCGRTCTWTVPNGVTCARFQIWGAGAGTGFTCCCGFTPFGGTGAYASVIMPVSAGWSYTLCAGCALCCCATAGGTNDTDGCASWVQGCNLSNFCAEGGEGSIFCQSLVRCLSGVVNNSNCVFLGGCICNNNSVCFGPAIQGGGQGGLGVPSCCFDAYYPMISSCKTFFGSATGGTVFGIRGSFGGIGLNCNGTVLVQHPPIYGFASTSCCCCIITTNYASGWCRSAQNGFLRVPGAGGFAHFKCGGGTSNAGDRGKFGMVCVSFR